VESVYSEAERLASERFVKQGYVTADDLEAAITIEHRARVSIAASKFVCDE